MARISAFDLQARLRGSRGISADDLDFGDVFGIAVQETLRTLPTQTIMRGARNLFDSSEKLSPQEANNKFNLQGKAAFADDDEVTMDMASERAEDQARLARNQYIQGMYAQENPTLSVMANLTGSLAAGFLDPTLIAMNVGASVAMTRGLQALSMTKVGKNAVNAVGQYDIAMGRQLIRLYDTKAQQTVSSVAMREGLENFTASIMEESLNFAGVGEERLARNVTAQESLRNIIIGTTIGTGLGMALDRSARAGMMQRWNRLWGDKAAEYADVQSKITDLESDLGVAPDMSHANKRIDEDTFDAKPQHGEVKAHVVDATEVPKETEFYLPKDGDQFVSVSTRGGMVSFTNSEAHAKNLGKQVDKFELGEDFNIMTPKAFDQDPLIKRGMAEDFAEDITRQSNPLQQEALVRKLYDEDLDLDGAGIVDVDVNELASEIARDLEQAKTLDEMLEMVEEYSTTAQTEVMVADIIGNNLKANDFDGYTFHGKGASGEQKYTGVSIFEESLPKLKKTESMEVAEPTFKQKEELKLRRAAEDEAKAERLEKRARAARSASDDEEVLPVEIELAEGETLDSVYQTNKQYKEIIDDRYADLEALREAGGLTKEQEVELRDLNDIVSGKQADAMVDEEMKQVKETGKCLGYEVLEEATEEAKPNFAPDDIGF